MTAYRLFSPGGNLTALVEEAVPAGAHARIASEILGSDPQIEQVGFIVPDGASFRLDMMGGELCVNAGLAAALLWSERTGETAFSFELSDVSPPVSALVHPNSVSLTFPLSLIRTSEESALGWQVVMDGMFALVTSDPHALVDPEATLKAAMGSEHPAGVLICVSETDGRTVIDPYVWVERTQTFMRESSCGSGSIAVAFVALRKGATSSLSVEQPSGAMCTVSINEDERTIEYRGAVAEVPQRTMSQTGPAILRGAPRKTMV